jgi:hypothetical protein
MLRNCLLNYDKTVSLALRVVRRGYGNTGKAGLAAGRASVTIAAALTVLGNGASGRGRRSGGRTGAGRGGTGGGTSGGGCARTGGGDRAGGPSTAVDGGAGNLVATGEVAVDVDEDAWVGGAVGTGEPDTSGGSGARAGDGDLVARSVELEWDSQHTVVRKIKDIDSPAQRQVSRRCGGQ